jgi:hypothetical protein
MSGDDTGVQRWTRGDREKCGMIVDSRVGSTTPRDANRSSGCCNGVWLDRNHREDFGGIDAESAREREGVRDDPVR